MSFEPIGGFTMRKLSCLFSVLVLLASCGSSGAGGKPVAMSTSSGTYFLASSSSSKAMARATTSGSTLAVVENGTIDSVTFYNTEGTATSVAVSHAIELSDGRLVIGLTYSGDALAYIADPTTGDMTALDPAPDGWTYAREDSGYLYYIASSTLYRADLSTGEAVAFSGAGEATDTDAWIKVTSYSGVLAVSGGVQRFWPSVGGTMVGPEGTAITPPSEGSGLEGLDGTIYLINPHGTDVLITTYTESGTSGGYVGAITTLCTTPWSTSSGVTRLSSARSTHDLSLGMEGGIVRVVATSAGLSYSTTAETIDNTYIGIPNSYTIADGAMVYHAFHEIAATGDGYDVTKYHIWSIATGTLTAKALEETTKELVTAYNVDRLAVVDGLLFYTQDTGSGVQTMVYNGSTSSVYASGEVSVEAVE
jgi:hypothetical protein